MRSRRADGVSKICLHELVARDRPQAKPTLSPDAGVWPQAGFNACENSTAVMSGALDQSIDRSVLFLVSDCHAPQAFDACDAGQLCEYSTARRRQGRH